GEILVAALAHGIANEHPECQRITVPISPDGVRLELRGPCRRELERVDGTGVAEVMIVIAGDVFWTAAAEAQSARHAHEIDDADLGGRIPGYLSPLGHGRRVLEPVHALVDQDAHERTDDALPHG